MLDTLNPAIHSQINSLLAQDAKIPFEYDELDIDKFIQNMNQTLWNAICILTQSTSERQGLSKVTEPLTSSYHIKNKILCNVMFCTDDRCSFPLHTLVTDVVDSQPLPLPLSLSLCPYLPLPLSLSLPPSLPPSLRLKVVKQRDKSETLFRRMLKEDKEVEQWEGTSYIDFLCQIHRDIKELLN